MKWLHSGHFLVVRLSCLNLASLELISSIKERVYFFISLIKIFDFCSFLAILANSISHFAVNSGSLRSCGTNFNNCFPLFVTWISLPLFSIKKVLNNFSIISARVATVPKPPVLTKVELNCFEVFFV